MARCRRGERPALSEYMEKHPELAEQIRDLFPALLVMEDLGSVGGELTGPFAPKSVGDGDGPPRQLGEYRIVRQVGRGGMGVVYEAVQESLGRHVAVKVLPFHAALTATQLERFHREARAVARLHHSNIVPVFGVGEDKGVHYYAMQFIQGQSLDAVLEELKQLRPCQNGSPLTTPLGHSAVTVSVAQGLLTGQFQQRPLAGEELRGTQKSDDTLTAPGSQTRKPGQDNSSSVETRRADLTGSSVSEYYRGVARVGVQVAEALEYAHRNGILHRDIKPSNLLLDTQGIVWITDFGLAKADDCGELTNPGDIVGTLRFMAPERFVGQADPRSDVYSLGITLYEMLTLRPAFSNADKMELIERVTNGVPLRPRKLDPQIPRDLETIVLKAIAKEPADRYPTAKLLAEDLRRFLVDRPIRARRASLVEQAWRWCRRNRAVATLMGAVAFLLLTLSVGVPVGVLLRGERNAALANLERAERAEAEMRTEKQRATASGHLAQARAYRWSGQVGQRFKSLEELGAAARFRPSLELRNEAIACLALTDVRRAKAWNGFPPGTCALAFDARLERYARSDAQGNISVRRVADDGEIVRLPGFGTHAWILRFSPDGQFLAATYHLATEFRVWNLARGETVLTTRTFRHMDFRPDSRWVAVDDQSDGSIRFYDLASRVEARRLALPADGRVGHAIAFHPDGRQLAVTREGVVEIYDLDASKVVMTVRLPAHADTLSWRSDGKFLATTSADRCLYVWDICTGRQQAVLRGHDGLPTATTFSHDGELLASTGWDVTLRLWDPMRGRLLLTVPGGVAPPCFSPDDRLLAYTATGSQVELWEVGTGATCRVLQDPLTDGEIHSTAFSKDGRLLASASFGGVRLWDGRSGREVARLPIGEPRSVLFHPADGSLFTSGSRGVYHWPVAADRGSPHDLRIGPPRQLVVAPETWQIALSSDGHSLAVVDRGQALSGGSNPPSKSGTPSAASSCATCPERA
jgi:serine/threonine protein kinase/WD40 repeat protein